MLNKFKSLWWSWSVRRRGVSVFGGLAIAVLCLSALAAQVAPTFVACISTLPCTISGTSAVWNFAACSNIEIAGTPLCAGGGGIGGGLTIPLVGAHGDGQGDPVNCATSSGISTCTLIRGTFVSGDVGKNFAVRSEPAPAPQLLIPAQQCVNSSTTNVPSCTGTGTLGAATTGTAQVIEGSTTVTWITGSAFSTNFAAWNGLTITLGGVGYTVAQVINNKTLQLTAPFTSLTGTNTVTFVAPAAEAAVNYVMAYVTGSGDGMPSLEGSTNLLAGTAGVSGLIIPQLSSVPSGVTQVDVWASIDPGVSLTTPETTYAGVESGEECYQGRFSVSGPIELDSITGCLQMAVTALGRTSGVVTLTTGSSLGVSVGQWVRVEGAEPPSFDGIFQVTSVVGLSITYAQPNYADASATVTSAQVFAVSHPGNQWTSGTITAVNTGTNTATLSITLAAGTLTNVPFAWGTPDNTPFATALALLDANRGGCIGIPKSSGYYYLTPPGISSSSPYFCLQGAGAASGQQTSVALQLAGLNYLAVGTSEIGCITNTPCVTLLGPLAPRQQWAGPTIQQVGFSDPLMGISAGAIYFQSINHFNINYNGFAYFQQWGSYGFQCDADSPHSFCQFGNVIGNTGIYMWGPLQFVDGRSSEVRMIGNQWISASTGGGQGEYYTCNGGQSGGGNDTVFRDSANYFPVAYYVCDQNGSLFTTRAENTLGATVTAIIGHGGTGTGMLLIGSGNSGPTSYLSIQHNGATESGSTAQLNVSVVSTGNVLPPQYQVGAYISVTNVPVKGYNGGPFQITAESNPVGSTPAYVQYTPGVIGLGTSGGGQVNSVNSCQKNNFAGTLTGFEFAVVLGAGCDQPIMDAWNLGSDNANQVADGSTDAEAFTNQGLALQVVGPPAMQIKTSVATPTCTQSLFTAATDQYGANTAFQVDCGSGVGFGSTSGANLIFPTYNINNIPNGTTIGTFLNTLAQWTSGTAQLFPAGATTGLLGVVTPGQNCTYGNIANTMPCIGIMGQVHLLMDGAVTAGHYAIPSSTQAGTGHDNSSTPGSLRPQILITQTASDQTAPTPITTICTVTTNCIGTGTLNGQSLFLSALCVNASGGMTPQTEIALTLTSSQNVLQINTPPCDWTQNVGWLPLADRATCGSAQTCGSGNEVFQPINTTTCPSKSTGQLVNYFNGSTLASACAPDANYSEGGVTNPPANPNPGQPCGSGGGQNTSCCPANGGLNAAQCAPVTSTDGPSVLVQLQ